MKVLSNLSLYGTLGLNSVADANTDTDKFLVIDSNGIVKYRTGQELYNDIGAGGAASYTSTLQHEVKAGVALTKGQAVYVTSADGTNMIVSKASNASEATSSKTLGLIAQDLSINGKGFVITEGLLSGLNTMAAGTEGDPVWLGTDGNLIYGLGSKPYAPAHLVFIGIVTRRSANNGEIFVKVQNGFELQELHNVQITSTPSDNTVLAYETSTSLYKMKSIPTLLGYTPTTNARTLTINGTSYDLSADRSWSVGTHTGNLTTGYVPKATGATTLTDSIIYDNGSGIGINTASPYDSANFKLDVNGGVIIKNTSGTLAQLILINSNPATGGNNGFVQFTAGGNTATAFAELQSYYGLSVASGALRLQPAGGQVLIGTRTASAFTTDINGTLRVSGQLTLGSTISNNTYVYTMPGASGTLALISDIPSLSGYVPTSRTLTINGVSYDLSADRSWSITAGVSSVQAGSGISVSTSGGVATVSNTGLLSGTAGSGISVSTSGQNLNIVNTGLLSGTAGSGISVSTSGQNLNIVNTGLLSATAGSGISVSTSSQNVNIVNTGLLSATAGTGISVSTSSGVLTIANTITNNNQLTNGAGYITGITSGMVTTALGYTPYNATNPNGYISSYTETDTLASVTGRGASTSTAITINGIDSALKVQHDGTSVAWRGRIGSFNASADKSSFLGNYTGRAGVFGHNNALSAWDELWVNTLGIYGQGNLYLSWFTYVKANGGDTNYAVLHAGNYNSYSPTLTGVGASGTWGISISGNANTATTAINSSQLNGISSTQIFNNMGNTHSTWTDFNSINGFGFRYVQGSTNGPGTGSSQFYGFSIGLGNDYAFSDYALQLAMPRYISGDKYFSVRTREAGTWSSWAKISAGYADTAGSLSSMNISQFTNNSGYITGETDTLATVVSRGNSTGGGRPITLDSGGGSILVRASTGGWSMGTYYQGSSGTTLAGFGAYGGNNSLTWAWIGPGFENPWMTINSSQATFNTPISNGNFYINGNGYGTSNADEWPHIYWLRNTGAGWDEGLIKGSSSRGFFGRAGWGIHMDSSKAFHFFSSGWDSLFGVEGGTGNTRIKGTLNVGTGGSNNGSLLNITGGVHNQVNITQGNTWGLLLGYCNEGSVSGYHGPNSAAIINVQDGPLHLGTGNASRVTVLGNGNVTFNGSIGLAVTADVRLSVNGDAHVANIVYLGGTAGSVGSWGTRTYGYGGDWTNNSRTVRFDNVGYGTNWSFTIDTGGNVQSSGSIIVGINGSSNSYSAASSGRLYFGTNGSDSPQYYNISTNMENFGGNYTKLDFSWYTGQRFYAHNGYGGFRFKEITGGQATLFSIGEGDLNVRVANTLFIGGNTALHSGNYTSYTDGRYWFNNGSWFADLGSFGFSRLFGNESSGGGFAIMTNPNNGGQTSILIDGSYFAGENGGHWSLNANNQYASRVGFYHDGSTMNFRTNNAILSTANIRVYPVSESWAEGIAFMMPNTNVWGGLRWQRQRSNSDGNWYIGFTALDSTDDLVFGANNGGSQVDNILRLSKNGSVSFAGTVSFTSSTYPIFAFSYGNTASTSAQGLQVYSSGGQGAIMAFHRGGYYAVNMGLDSDNVFRIGGWSASANRLQLDMSGNLTVAGDVTAFSDARVKENVKTIENALDKVLGLRGVSYTRTDSQDKKTKIGVIAQETLPIVPEVVNQDNDGMYNVSYGNFGGLFIEAFKEQQKQIKAQAEQISELKSIVNALTK